MHGQVLSPDPVVHSLQLRPEILPLDVEVEDTGVVNQDRKGAVSQVLSRLAKNLQVECIEVKSLPNGIAV